MTSRLDRLLSLLDTGSSHVTRRAAAQQLGEIQRLHPDEWNVLLSKVSRYLQSANWDTRIAAAHAVEAIVANVPLWDPAPTPLTDGDKDRPSVYLNPRLSLESFDVSRVLSCAKRLLASEGKEFDVKPAYAGQGFGMLVMNPFITNMTKPTKQGVDRDELLRQRERLHAQLGLAMAEKIGIDTSGLFTQEDLVVARTPDLDPTLYATTAAAGVAGGSATASDTAPSSVVSITDTLSGKRKAVGEQSGGIPAKSTKRSRSSRRSMDENVVAVSALPNVDSSVLPKLLDECEEWPLAAFTEALAQDIFSPLWELRHGAATALREIIKIHGSGAGRCKWHLSAEEMRHQHQLTLEDLGLRLVCVLALDKFGDFVSEQVVAPVRETCAQALGHVIRLLDSDRVTKFATVLLALLSADQWEARHGALLGIKYLIAVRSDLRSSLLPRLFDPIFANLDDHNDDVAAVAASAFVPVVDALKTELPHKVPLLLDRLWEVLLELDDLTSSTSSILLLLSKLLESPKSVDFVVQCKGSLVELVPRLWPFLSHHSVQVRKSVLMSLIALIQLNDSASRWLDVLINDVLRLVFQRCLLETDADLKQLLYTLWEAILAGVHLDALLEAACPHLGTWWVVLMHPTKLPLDVSALGNAWLNVRSCQHHSPTMRNSSGNNKSVSNGGESSFHSGESNGGDQYYLGGGPEILNESPVSRERMVLECRLGGTRCLGALSHYVTQSSSRVDYSQPGVESPEVCYARLALFHLRSRSAIQRMIAAHVLREWLKFTPQDRCPVDVVDAVRQCVCEPFQLYDEMAQAFTRVQHDARDFVSLMRHYKVPVDDAYQPGAMYTLEMAKTLSTSVFQSILEGHKLKPKAIESLEEKRRMLDSSLVTLQREQSVLATRVHSSLSCLLVTIGGAEMPPKLNPIVRPLVESIRTEEFIPLQRLSAEHLVRVLEFALNRDPCPNGKILKNLSTSLCGDAQNTPVITSKGQTRGILSLVKLQQKTDSMFLRRGNSNNRTTAVRGGGSATPNPSTPTTPLPPQSTDEEPANGTGTGTGASVKPEREIERRGAEFFFKHCALYFGSELFSKLPALWEMISVPIEGIARSIDCAANTENENKAPKLNELSTDKIAELQEAVCAMQVLQTIAEQLHADLHEKVEKLLEVLVLCLDHWHCAIQHMAARVLGQLAKVLVVPVINVLLEKVLPRLGAMDSEVLREGAVEVIYCIIENLEISVVPYVAALIVPIMGRMSDPCESVRQLSTLCFASLVRLLPLALTSSTGSTNQKTRTDEVGGANAPVKVKEEPKEESVNSDKSSGLSSSLTLHLSEKWRNKLRDEEHFLEQLLDAKKADDYIIPVPIRATLRRYQQEGVNWLAFLNKYKLHGILCDDMGLGKTLQSICILAADHYYRHKEFKATGNADVKPLPSIVICPPTLTGHWVYEVEKFVDDDVLSPLHYTGTPLERSRLQNSISKHNLVVASYDIVRNDIDFFLLHRWNYCILDEGHIIKNGRTKMSKMIKQLVANHRLILTGTPIQNNVIELWSLFDFLMPGFLGTERQFMARYARPIIQSRDAKSSSKEQEAGVLAMESLHRQVLPFVLRRMKEDVLSDLPPKIVQDYYCELTPLQVKLYEDFARSRAMQVVDSDVMMTSSLDKPEVDESTTTTTSGAEKQRTSGGKHAHIFQALQYLRKVCNHPKLVLNPDHPQYTTTLEYLAQHQTNISDISHSTKLGALRQLLLDCGIGASFGEPELDPESVVHAHRALIFCQLKSMLDIVENDLLKAHMPSVSYVRLDGGVPAAQRHHVVRKFNDDPSIDVMLLTTQVGGLGLNLTGADTVIFVDHDWNPSRDLQAMDRAHRIGQRKVVNVYRLVTRNTLEEKIMGLQKFKLGIAQTVVSGDNSSLATMGTDQLLDLFTLTNAGNNMDGTKQLGNGANTKSGAMTELLQSQLWDHGESYEEEYDIGTFLKSLAPSSGTSSKL